MLSDKPFDFGQDRLLLHGADISRVITRTSMAFEGDYTKLRAITRALIPDDMDGALEINMEKLRADMANHVERTSARKFSIAATGGTNPDFYRNFTNNGQDKRLSAKVFMGIVSALGRDPFEYVIGVEPRLGLPSASVLMSTFAVLLESLGIDPIEGARAQKLASSFPGALRRSLDLQAQAVADQDLPDGEDALAPGEGRPSA